MLKHLAVVSMLSGFKVQLSQPMGEASNTEKILMLFLAKRLSVNKRIYSACWDLHTPNLRKKQNIIHI
jgi:hypothetical protein